MSSEPAIVSMRCLAAEPNASYAWHEHPFHEFTFVSDDNAIIGYSGAMRPAAKDTLVFYHRRERHAGASSPSQRPRFWVVHFTAPDSLLAEYPSLAARDPERRRWNLPLEQAEAFRWLFLQILNERTRLASHQTAAESAWLRLLLINIDRWTTKDSPKTLMPGNINPDVARLWHFVNSCVGKPSELPRHIQEIPNYDSLRHGFKRAFGMSPREMILRLRIQHAKNLLLETNLRIHEIAERCGYQRQHEFARAFRQHTGASPSAWREQPLARLSGPAK